ncbi:MAG: hypothetical protein KF744_06565 [Taibaiella sp.]|nr:hypothetical protein [Taibaiella sp.]
MNYDTIKLSLDFINKHFKKQISVQSIPLMVPVEGTIMHTRSGDFRQEYQLYDFFIATKLNLFESHSLVSEISKGLTESPNVDEVKRILLSFIRTADENVNLYHEICKIRYGEGTFNDFHECIPIINKKMFFVIEEDKRECTTHGDLFETELYASYNRKRFDISDFYIYSITIRDFVQKAIGDWIEEKERSNKLSTLELKKLTRDVYFYKDLRWWMGVLAGAITTSITLLSIYLSHIKDK